LQAERDVRTIETDAELIGYELHLVEQWACSRTHPTFLVVTFTGVPAHKVAVGVISVPTEEGRWPPRLKLYLEALSGHYARRKDTALGTIMVTNLNSFPSALTVIPIPDSGIKGYRDNFIINENLKRLGCSGRSALNLGPPSAATEAKFMQLYGTSDRVSLGEAVIEIVKMCQVVLIMFTKLDAEYRDGLLCDLTEHAINDWWAEVGMDYFTVEPGDGVLGPSTVASLIGLFLGARNRLNACGAPVPKDAFEIKAMKRGIGHFQKSQKIPRTRRLDHTTLDRLHRVTSKAANSEGWAVPRAVKSTVAELSGKGGEMVMGMVGARDRTGIADVETADLQKFVNSLSGERCRWLWQGRPKKLQTEELIGGAIADDEHTLGGEGSTRYSWSGKRPDVITDFTTLDNLAPNSPINIYSHMPRGSQSSLSTLERDQTLPKTVLKSVTGRMNDAKTGLGRFKDAVGIPSRKNRPYKELQESISRRTAHTGNVNLSVQFPSFASTSTPYGAVTNPKNSQQSAKSDQLNVKNTSNAGSVTEDEPSVDAHTVKGRDDVLQYVYSASAPGPHLEWGQSYAKAHARSSSQLLTKDADSYASSTVAQEQNPAIHGASRVSGPRLLRSTRSLDEQQMSSREDHTLDPPVTSLHRNVSFGVMETNFVGSPSQDGASSVAAPDSRLAQEQHRYLIETVAAPRIKALTRSWIRISESDMEYVEELKSKLQGDCAELETVHDQKLEIWHNLHGAVADLVRGEKSSVIDALKDAELLGAKLDYEMGTLKSKVEDVEDGVADLERRVADVEARAQELSASGRSKGSWLRQKIGFP
jgi:hypothetical protein